MRPVHLIFSLFFLSPSLYAQRLQWVSTTASAPWVVEPSPTAILTGKPTLRVDTLSKMQAMEGFGGCFNELGWKALGRLSPADRAAVLREWFAPGLGASFTICRMPVGANDFSDGWYSYDETPGDFSLTHFSIARDRMTLVPFIHAAQRYNARLRLWASPWSPPAWMKVNNNYACAGTASGGEGFDLFKTDEPYLKTYAQYFVKFLKAYKAEGITIGMVMPQNEFNSCQVFPSCTWTAASLNRFVGRYLGPALQPLGVELFFGTMERAKTLLVDTLLRDPASARYIRGVGFQWAGKGAIAGIHRLYPDLDLYQSEQECGDGRNDWTYAAYTWTLMKHYIASGARAYMYWNLALDEGGISHWGWRQNSLVTVDTVHHTFRYTPDYYVFKHLAHFVRPGARLVECSGPSADDALCFVNPDGSVVVVLASRGDTPRVEYISVGGHLFSATLPPHSFHTFILKKSV